jgi:hypothetical protein
MKYSRDLIPHIDSMPSRSRASFPEIADEMFWEFYGWAAPYSMVHVTGFYNVYQSMRYVATNDIPGDIAECGCFLGGIGIFMGLLRRHLELHEKTIYLYDTFAGPPEGESDVVHGEVQHSAPLPPYYDAVLGNIDEVLHTDEGYVLVRGPVEETLPASPEVKLCLMRLDTDFFSSTKVELEVLYPRLVSGGVLVVDDYGMYAGARRATDEFLATQRRRPLLNRIDGSVWAGVKP